MKSNKKKICFIAPSLQLGGLENAVAVMANYFASEGHEVTLILIYNFPRFYELHNSIKVIEPDFSKEKLFKAQYYFNVVRYIRRNLKLENPDTVISYGDFMNILVVMANLGLRYPLYISDRASPDLRFQWYQRVLRKVLYKRATGIIAQTERAASQKRRMLGDDINIKVIFNPIREIRLFPDVKRENYVLAVARHYPVKGLDRLVIAADCLKSTGWKLLIAGSRGPATPLLETLISQHGLEDVVEFLGNVKEVDKLAARCKIFVLPSRSEGFPNALIEAMAAGLACIAFDCSAGPREIITHGVDGLLVEEGNIRSLRDNILHLIKDEALREDLGRNALAIRTRLSLENTGRKYLNFILENQ